MSFSYLFDTNVLLENPNVLFLYENCKIYIPFQVLEELDKLKVLNDSVGFQARNSIRILEQITERGDNDNGFFVTDTSSLVFSGVKLSEPTSRRGQTTNFLSLNEADNHIIQTAMNIRQTNREEVIIVSNDFNVKAKAKALGFITEKRKENKARMGLPVSLKTTTEISVDEQCVDSLYKNKQVDFPSENHYTNECIVVKTNVHGKKSALCFYDKDSQNLKLLDEYWKKSVLVGDRDNFDVFPSPKHIRWIEPKNKEQQFAMNLLYNDNVSLVVLLGRSGTGKTLCALSSGLSQVLEGTNYNKMLVSRPIVPMGRDIGYIPGTVEAKLEPWIQPIKDNLEVILGSRLVSDQYISDGIIEVEALTYIRGRSLNKVFMIVDEVQNLSSNEIKTIVTRMGKGSKLVLTGDIEQIDNKFLNEESNGLIYLLNRFRGQKLFGHVYLNKGERSELATLASQIL